jgi:methylase of polypeptide subunit release factors
VCYDHLILPDDDEASLASALMPWHVLQVMAFWKMLMGSNSLKRVLDLSANVGCDALLLASMGCDEITSIEINKARFNCLVYNIAVMGFEKLITPIYSNCIDVINDFPEGTVFDAIYLDPPWLRDGEKYNPRRVFDDLYLISGIDSDGTKMYVSIFDVMTDIFKKGLTDTIVLKVPPSVKFPQLSDRAKKGNVPIMGIRGGKFAEYRLITVHPDDLFFDIAKSM